MQTKRSLWKLRSEKTKSFKILAGKDESPRSNPQVYPKNFRCKMDPEKKRKFSSWAIEWSFTQENRSKPAAIRSNNESELVIEISNEKESKILPAIKSLCSPHFQERLEVEIFSCDIINQSKGLIYNHEYNNPAAYTPIVVIQRHICNYM